MGKRFMAMLILGIMAISACSTKESLDYNKLTESSQYKENVEQNENLDLNEDASKDSKSETEVMMTDIVESDEEDEKSEEVLNLFMRMEDFCKAYFDGNQEDLKGFLSESFIGDIEVYESSEEVDEIEMKEKTGLSDVSELLASKEYELSKAFIIPGEDTLTYLTVEFINEDGEWKVSGYGLEK